MRHIPPRRNFLARIQSHIVGEPNAAVGRELSAGMRRHDGQLMSAGGERQRGPPVDRPIAVVIIGDGNWHRLAVQQSRDGGLTIGTSVSRASRNGVRCDTESRESIGGGAPARRARYWPDLGQGLAR